MRPIRFIIITIVLVLLAYGLQSLVYGSKLGYENTSNALFVLGMVIFFPSFIVQTGSYEIFYGMRYSFSAFFVKDFRKYYPSYSEYKEEKEQVITTTFFKELLVASILMIVVAAYLAGKVTYG